MQKEETKKSPIILILSLIFIIFAIALLIMYWFIPFNTIEFTSKPSHSNFNLNNLSSEGMQFYSNMRFPDKKISYKIQDCTLQKQQDMENAFQILKDLTILKFYPANNNQEISVTCSSQNKLEKGLFIAGEGGPTNITKTDKFSVILKGKILLIKDSTCKRPNIAIHELLHALGFKHSKNPNNIMYNFSKCSQTIGDDIPKLINQLYATPSYPDPSLENISATMHGKYLNTNISIRNNGLAKSKEINLKISSGTKIIKEIKIPGLDIGYGTQISLSNLWVSQINIKELKFLIDYNFNELEESNNQVILKIKN